MNVTRTKCFLGYLSYNAINPLGRILTYMIEGVLWMFHENNHQSRPFKDILETRETRDNTQIRVPRVPLPSSDSPLVLPGEPNPLNKPGLIPIFQYLSNVYQEYIRDQVNIGYLKVNATTESGVIPVPDVKITISKPLGNNFFFSQVAFTDSNGETPPVPLPTRSIELSTTPEFPVPYTIWNITAEAPGYYDIIVYDVPIFPNVTTTQSFNLIPIDSKENGVQEIYASSLKKNIKSITLPLC